MLRLTPILLALLYGLAAYHFSAWRTRRELDARSVELVDPGLAPALARMAEALDLQRIKVFLYEIDPVNGLAAPDGRIFLTRGLYQKYRDGVLTADELASVIAHELGHVALGHTRRRMIDFSGQNAMRAALAMVLGRILPGIGVWIANGLASLLAARLSRQDEFEADAYATALMIKAGIGVSPQIAMFRKLEQMGPGGRGAPAWLMSHPKTGDRIAAIEANALRWD